VLAAKPWKWTKAEKAAHDAKMVRALSKATGFPYGEAETSSKFSGLCLKKPENLKPKSDKARAYGRAVKALHDARTMFTDPAERAAMIDVVADLYKKFAKLTKAEQRRFDKMRAADQQ
jgi:hypothetical protein